MITLTGAHITGIDYAPEAIKRARERTRAKRPRLTFQEGDMNRLSLADAGFDTVIDIDSFAHSEDLEKLIARLKGILNSAGQMGCLNSQIIRSEAHLPKQTYNKESTN
ncbi:class I SAM-dependent methyltransferase [candidate division CSSED10-310 bacterium]|uniref:Class I SAM-dependent methyltransferase n=1 Tax=candidate division CSSED10-310 bacterium TaxID=2855610 RepID=A0ABV6Z2P2_UNCC1